MTRSGSQNRRHVREASESDPYPADVSAVRTLSTAWPLAGDMADDMEEVRKQVRSLVQELRDADPVVAAAGERP